MKKLRVMIAFALVTALITITVPMFGVKAQETLIWEADVPSQGGPVTSPMLQSGWEYRIVAKGWFISCKPMWGWVIYAGDAQYYTEEFYGTFTYGPDWGSYLPAPGGHSFLQIDGMDVSWGPFSNVVHEYTTYYTGTGAPITFTIVDWIDGNYSQNFCHIHVQIYERPPPPEAETAFAYGGDYATCFKYWGFKNWGWSNGPLGHGNYSFDLYAGAAKCNINKGTKVGTLIIAYAGSNAWIAYYMDAGFAMERTHLYVDGEPLPRNGGKYTVSPGQYPYHHDPVADPTYDDYWVTGLSGDIYVIAHADVIEV